MPPARAWLEPTAILPLAWGTAPERRTLGLALIVGGAAAVAGTNNWTLALFAAGIVTHIAGWSILPARGWRRILAAILGFVNTSLLLAGPQSMWAFLFGLAAWLLVRHRPPRAWGTLLLPLGNGILMPQLFEEYSGMLPATAISLAVTIGAAWLARLIAASVPVNSAQQQRADTTLG